MLSSITVNNLALIKRLEISFGQSLNVFTGETGAGKSIIVDSLMLLIGGKYDKTMLKYGEDKGYVEGVFNVADVSALEDMGIDCEDGMFIVTRKFYKDGRNEIRVNGKQVTTAMLRELMSAYVDIYGQNENQSLLKAGAQRKILDKFVFGADVKPLDDNRKLYDEYKAVVGEMRSLGDERARAQRIDVLRFQIEEIEAAAVKEGEEQALIDKRHVLMASERIKSALAECMSRLDTDEGASVAVTDALHSLSSVSNYSDAYSALHDRLKSVSIELDDIAESVSDELDKIGSDERELDAIIARLDKLRALKNKYGAFDAMQKFLENAKRELERAENGAEVYAELEQKEQKLRAALYKSCKKLSEKRRAGAVKLAERIIAELNDLGMENSRFEAKFSEMPSEDSFMEKTGAGGFDDAEFYLSPNAGQPLLPLAKIISGGEMSRFMLAIKLITGDLGNIDTMIFDEIDAGISGAVGLEMAKKLCDLSRSKQALCVTHLPQIAAMADTHFFIEKHEEKGETVTCVTELDRSGQIGEISRLSGSKGVSTTSAKNAAELKDWTDDYKNKRS